MTVSHDTHDAVLVGFKEWGATMTVTTPTAFNEVSVS